MNQNSQLTDSLHGGEGSGSIRKTVTVSRIAVSAVRVQELVLSLLVRGGLGGSGLVGRDGVGQDGSSEESQAEDDLRWKHFDLRNRVLKEILFQRFYLHDDMMMAVTWKEL